MASLYIHIPFCLSKCGYCSFNSFPGHEHLFPRYVKALKKELIEHFFSGRRGSLGTIFFGGGTPSILSVEQIAEILLCCQEYMGIHEQAEITLEANPKTLDFMKLLQLHQAGINRISFGVQSFIDMELGQLGRLHSAQDSWDCVRDAFGAGFSNINVDLMYGVPGQTAERWRWNVANALALDLPHLSLYQLTIEEGTALAEAFGRGEVELPDEEEILRMDEISSELCRRNGLLHYEISNYAIPGFECRHNINYWHNREYLAIGAGAVEFFQGVRSKNIGDPLRYCEAVEAGTAIVEESERLSQEASFRESVVIGLRMVDGVKFGELYDRYGINLRDYYGERLMALVEEGLLEFTHTSLRLTRRGRNLANQVLAELV